MKKLGRKLLAALIACLLIAACALAEGPVPESPEIMTEAVEAPVADEGEFSLGEDGMAADDSDGIDLSGVSAPEDECAHEYTYEDNEYTTTFAPVDNRYHQRVENQIVRTVCGDCGAILSEESSVYYEGTENHTYNAQGICEECGHVNTCAHAESYTYIDWDEEAQPPRYTAVDNKYHEITGPAYRVTRCDDCRMELKRESLSSYTDTEWHSYNENGVCNECGHANTCQHPNAYEEYQWDWEQGEPAYTPIDNRYHQASGHAYKYMYCEDCGLRLGETQDAGTRTEEYTHDYVDGVCEACGHVNTCKHENRETYTSWNWGSCSYAPIDNRYHSVSGEQFLVTTCMDCGESLDRVSNGQQTDLETHDYTGSGLCTTCGHVNTCTHPRTENWTYWSNGAKYTEIDNKYHSVSGEKFQEKHCSECNIELGRTSLGNRAERDTHSYDSQGKCRECGHINTCKHANLDAYTYWSEVATYTPVDNKTHKVKGEQYKRTYCMDCNMTIKRESLGVQSGEEQHHYEGGICEQCGHKNTCAHKHTEKHYYFDYDESEYTRLDAKTHRVTGEKYEDTYCSDCESTISTKSLGVKTETERHSYYWEDSECRCGATSQVVYLSCDPIASMGIGDTWKLNVKGHNNRDKVARISLKYSSSNSKVLKVSNKGLVKAVKAGKATLTVDAANGLQLKLDVQVNKQPKALKLSDSKKTLILKDAKKGSFRLTGKFAKKTGAVLTYKSSDSKVAKVDLFGNVTAVGEGKCTITATTLKGLAAECAVTVQDPNAPTRITLTQGKSLSLKKGKRKQLTVKFTPAGTTSSLTWKSSDPKIAAVSKKGLVTAKGKGIATITVTTKGGKSAKIKITVK